MSQDNLIQIKTPEPSQSFTDALTALVRQGARQIIEQAVEAELVEFLSQYQELKAEQGRRAVVRNGYLPERTITTGVGEVEVQVAKVRDRTRSGIKFNSTLLPPYLKRSRECRSGAAVAIPQRGFNGRFCRSFECLAGSTSGGIIS